MTIKDMKFYTHYLFCSSEQKQIIKQRRLNKEATKIIVEIDYIALLGFPLFPIRVNTFLKDGNDQLVNGYPTTEL